MRLIARDFLPKRPTLARAVDASGALSVAAVLAVGAAVPAWRAGVARWGEQALGVEVFLIVMMLFVTRVSMIEGARGVLRALQLLAMGWYVVAFCAVLALLSWFSGSWWPLAAGVLLVAARARTLLTRREALQREILFARSVLDFATLWVAALAGLPLSFAVGDGTGMTGYALLFFLISGLLDLFGVLVPEPSGSSP